MHFIQFSLATTKPIQCNPKYDYAWSNKGNALNNLGEILGSIGGVNTIIIIAFYSIFFSLNQAIQLNPKNDYAWNNKGFALNNLGKY